MSVPLWGDRYFHTLAEDTYREFAFRSSSPEDLRRWQKRFRARLGEALGLPAIMERGPSDLSSRLVSRVELEDHVREDWTIFTEPGFELRFYLLRPLSDDGDRPAVLTPHGHNETGRRLYVGIYDSTEEARDGNEGERDIALQAVHAGYVALAPDMRGFSDTRIRKDIEGRTVCSCRVMQMRALLYGRTLLGERVWDMIRLIDFAQTQSGIDTSKLIITGNSGGGTVSLFTAALDDRIAVAIPASYFCTFEDSIGSIEHCPCNYVPGLMRLGEMHDVAGLIAPRPFLAVNGRKDPIFPIEATRYAFSRLKEIYTVAGASSACELYEGAGGHRYYKERVWPFVKERLS